MKIFFYERSVLKVHKMMRLQEIRKSEKITQEQLAEIIGVKANTISQYESGVREPNIRTLIDLADLFDVTVDYLIGRSDERK